MRIPKRSHSLNILLCVIAGTITALSYPSPAFANPCLNFFTRLFSKKTPVPLFETAVELELDLTPQTLSLLTTTNGKVSGLLGRYEAFPVEMLPILEKIKSRTPGIQNIDDLPFEALNVEEFQSFLRVLSQKRNAHFAKERQIPGLLVKPTAPLTFEKPTTLFGKEYAAGTHQVSLKPYFGESPVEYGGVKDVITLKVFEIHQRSALTAGNAIIDSQTFLQGIGYGRSPQHIHIVAPLPSRLAEKKTSEVLRVTDFFARANLASEIISVKAGKTLAPVFNEDQFFFAALEPDDLKGIAHYFGQVSNGKNPVIKDQFKMSLIGFRGSDKYDRPGLWGIEPRFITENDPLDFTPKFLNDLQKNMHRENWSIGEEEIKKWYRFMHQKSPERAIAASWYNQDPDLLRREAQSHVQREFPEFFSKDAKSFEPLKKMLEQRPELKMLVFNWGHSPIFYGSGAATEAMAQAQVNALREILRQPANPNLIRRVMNRFFIESGLEDRVFTSLQSLD